MYTKRYTDFKELIDYWGLIKAHKECPQNLSNDEIIELIKYDDTPENRMKLVDNNLLLVYTTIVTKCKHIHYDIEEMLGIGNMGLIKAALNFDVNRGIKFSTFAVNVIYNAITNVTKRKMENHYYNTISLNEPLNSLESGDLHDMSDVFCLQNTLVDPSTLQNVAIDNLGRQEDKELLKYIMDNVTLSDIETRVILNYFGFYDEGAITLTETAHRVGLSLGGARKALYRALNKIRQFMNKNMPGLLYKNVV